MRLVSVLLVREMQKLVKSALRIGVADYIKRIARRMQ